MKTTNIFYPSALVWLVNTFYDWVDVSPWGGFYPIIILLLSPIIIFIIPTWYIMDVIANAWDWFCMKVFVELPLWGMRKAEEYERIRKR